MQNHSLAKGFPTMNRVNKGGITMKGRELGMTYTSQDMSS